MPQVVVTIDGKTYRMACAEGEEPHLEALAERFDRTLSQLKEAFGAIGDRRLTVMTGISVMDQLVDAERKIAEQGARLDEIGRLRDEATDRLDQAEGDITGRIQETTRQIERIATKLKALR